MVPERPAASRPVSALRPQSGRVVVSPPVEKSQPVMSFSPSKVFERTSPRWRVVCGVSVLASSLTLAALLVSLRSSRMIEIVETSSFQDAFDTPSRATPNGVVAVEDRQIHLEPTTSAIDNATTNENGLIIAADSGTTGVDTQRHTSEATTSQDAHVATGTQSEMRTFAPAPVRERGTLDRHVFLDLCAASVDAGRSSPKYPYGPDRRDQLTGGVLQSSLEFDNYFERIFGYLHPDISGSYKFAITCDDHCELWIGADDRPCSEELVAYVGSPSDVEGAEWARPTNDFNAFPSQQSNKSLDLQAGRRYWIEVLHVQRGAGENVSVAWIAPSASGFLPIPTANTSPYMNADSVAKGVVDNSLPAHLPSHVYRSPKPAVNTGVPINANTNLTDARESFIRLPFAGVDEALGSALPQCGIPLSYARPAHIARYVGAGMVSESAVYPKDGTALWKGDIFESENRVIPDLEAQTVVKEYMGAVNARLRELRRPLLELVTIVNVVQKRHAVGPTPGYCFLIELEVRAEGSGTDVNARVSQYVYLPDNALPSSQYGGSRLCASREFAWNPRAKVHMVIAVKNQGAWVRHLVADVEQLLRETGDRNFRLILVDFDSVDIDVEAHLAASQLPRDMWHVVKRTGSFERAGGIQSGVEAVKSPDDIVFLSDLHLEMPRTIIEDMRRYTVRGRKVYAPVVVRLACGRTPETPNGFWEKAGYGLMALYRADYDRIGGMNTNEYKTTRGGEDWEFMDRVFTSGYEVERLRIAKFYHFFHSKRGLWDVAVR